MTNAVSEVPFILYPICFSWVHGCGKLAPKREVLQTSVFQLPCTYGANVVVRVKPPEFFNVATRTSPLPLFSGAHTRLLAHPTVAQFLTVKIPAKSCRDL